MSLAENLPLTSDHEGDHSTEDAALWLFIKLALVGLTSGNAQDRETLRAEAEAFVAWDEAHADRVRWYA